MKFLFRMNYLSLVLFLLISSLAKGLFHIPLAVKLGSSLLPAGLAVYEYFNCRSYDLSQNCLNQIKECYLNFYPK